MRCLIFIGLSFISTTIFALQNYCGWLDHPTTFGYYFYDKSGEIKLAEMGEQPEGIENLPQISEDKEYVHTVANYGYSCVCMPLEIDFKTKVVKKIFSGGKQKLLEDCLEDHNLKVLPALQFDYCAKPKYQDSCKISLKNIIKSFDGLYTDTDENKNYAKIESDARVVLPQESKETALILQILPAKDNSMIALVYGVCHGEIDYYAQEYTTYLVLFDMKTAKSKLIAKFITYSGANIRKISIAKGWIGSTKDFLMQEVGFDAGAGGSCASYTKTIFDMNSAKVINTISSSASAIYYDDLSKMIDSSIACYGGDKIYFFDLVHGGNALIKDGNGKILNIKNVERQGDKWFVGYTESNETNAKMQKLELPASSYNAQKLPN